MTVKTIANTAFILGVLLAIVIGLIPLNLNKSLLGLSVLTYAIIIVGFFVGVLNLKANKTNTFLITTFALLFLGNAGLFAVKEAGVFISGIVINIIAFVAPAALLVAIKAVYEMAV